MSFVALFVSVGFLCLSLFIHPALAQEDRVLEKSGILYPGGYDVNTVGEVRGKAYNLVIPDQGPARFSLATKRDTYTVFASPGWYWKDSGIIFKNGDVVNVIGSKSLGKDGNLYIIAREIRQPDSGKSIFFRGNNGGPLWKSMGTGSMGGRGGFGSPGGARGGMGGAGGGAGRGRR